MRDQGEERGPWLVVNESRGMRVKEDEGQGGKVGGGEGGNRCECERAWWGGWAPINRRAAAPHLSTLPQINRAIQIGI